MIASASSRSPERCSPLEGARSIWRRRAPAAMSRDEKIRILAERGLIEIDLGGRRVRVDAGVNAEALARVLDVLSGR